MGALGELMWHCSTRVAISIEESLTLSSPTRQDRFLVHGDIYHDCITVYYWNALCRGARALETLDRHNHSRGTYVTVDIGGGKGQWKVYTEVARWVTYTSRWWVDNRPATSR